MESLSTEQRTAVDVSKLTPLQVGALDALIAHDLTLARQGGVTGFANGFTARHTAKELSEAGVDRLSEAERSRLDLFVAQVIAVGPSPLDSFSYAPPARPVPVQEVDVTPPHAQVHGDLSMSVGAGSHGSSFYGTSMDVNVTDPTGHFTLGVGFSDYHTKGLICPYPAYAEGPPYLGW